MNKCRLDIRDVSTAGVTAFSHLTTLRRRLFRGGRLTKVCGVTASLAPEASHVGAACLLALGASFGTMGVLADANAGSCIKTAQPGEFQCTGPADAQGDAPIKLVSDQAISIRASGDFGMATEKDDQPAVHVGASGGLTFDHTGQQAIQGKGVAVQLENRQSGDISFVSSGDIVSKTDSAVVTLGQENTGNVSVMVDNVSSTSARPERPVVKVGNLGTGSTSLTASGRIDGGVNQGGLGRGIEVENGPNAQDIAITAADVEAQADAIHVEARGTKGVTLTAGKLASRTAEGVRIQGFGGGDINVTTDAVTAGKTGVSVVQEKAADTRSDVGSLHLTVNGQIDAGADGINALTTSAGRDLSITAKDTIKAKGHGIYAGVNGRGSMHLKAQDIQSDGIGIVASSAALDSAAISIEAGAVTSRDRPGIFLMNAGAGKVDITANGPVQAGEDGIYVNNFGGGTLDIHTKGSVTAGKSGLQVTQNGGGSATITADGTITAQGDVGIAVQNDSNAQDIAIKAADVTSESDAIRVNATGTKGVSVTAGDLVSRSGAGIAVDNSGGGDIAVVAGSVTSGDTGVYVLHAEAATAYRADVGSTRVTVNGKIDAGGGGIKILGPTEAGRDFTITAKDTIKSAGTGIYAINAGRGSLNIRAQDITVTNFGESGVWATNRHADSACKTVEVGAVTVNHLNGPGRGIIVTDESAGNVTVTANGAILSGSEGIDVDNLRGGTLDIHAKGPIDAGGSGIRVRQESNGSASIAADGAITTRGDYGIEFRSNAQSSTAAIVTTNHVTAGKHGIYANHAGTGGIDIKAKGIVKGSSGDGIRVEASNGVSIASHGTEGANNGIFAGAVGVGSVTVDAFGNVKGWNEDGIRVEGSNNTDLTVSAKFSVQGARHGIAAIQRSDAQKEADAPAVTILVTGGQIRGGSGYAIWTESKPDVKTRIVIDSQASLGSASGNAVYNGMGDSSIHVLRGAVVSGAFHLGGGDDYLEFIDTDLGNVTVLDGGGVTEGNAKGHDELHLRGYDMLALDGSKILNWETLSLTRTTLITSDRLAAGQEVRLTEGSILNGQKSLTVASNLNIEAGSRFLGHGGGTGRYAVTGNLTNEGSINLQDRAAGDHLHVGGNYTGDGVLAVDVDFTRGVSDGLVVDGRVSGPATTVRVNALSTGRTARSRDINLVTARDGIDPSSLRLAGPSNQGLWDYGLVIRPTQALLTRKVNAIGAAYEGAPGVLLDSFASLPTLEQRVSQRRWISRNDSGGSQIEGLWFRLGGDRRKLRPDDSLSGYSSKALTTTVQAGVDLVTSHSDSGYWVVGATGQHGRVNSTLTNAAGHAKVKGSGYGLGLTASWYGAQGTYVDSQLQVNRVSVDISSDAQGLLVDGQNRTLVVAGVGVGHHFDIGERTHWLVPQAQLSYGRMDGGAFTDSRQNRVDLGRANRLLARVGMTYQFRPNAQLRNSGVDGKMLYVSGNILRYVSTAKGAQVNDTQLATKPRRTWAEVGVGGSLQLLKGTLLYGEATYRTAIGGGSAGNKGLSANLGVRVNW